MCQRSVIYSRAPGLRPANQADGKQDENSTRWTKKSWHVHSPSGASSGTRSGRCFSVRDRTASMPALWQGDRPDRPSVLPGRWPRLDVFLSIVRSTALPIGHPGEGYVRSLLPAVHASISPRVLRRQRSATDRYPPRRQASGGRIGRRDICRTHRSLPS